MREVVSGQINIHIPEGRVTGGMIAKLDGAVEAVESGMEDILGRLSIDESCTSARHQDRWATAALVR